MATAGKKAYRLTTIEDTGALTLTIKYLDFSGATKDEWQRTYKVSDLDEGLVAQTDSGARLALYGLAKVLQDRTSDLVKLVGEQGPEVRLEGMDAVWNTLKTEGWNAKRKGGGTASLKKTTLYEAIARVKGVSTSQAQKAYLALDEEQQAKVRESEKVQAALNEIAAEAQGPADLGDLAG